MKKQLSFDVAGPYSSDLSFPEAGYGEDSRKKCPLDVKYSSTKKLWEVDTWKMRH